MNQVQRKFLIDKIEETKKAMIKALEDDEPSPPNLSNYILHAVMSGTFEIISNDAIREMIRLKALSAKAGSENWMSSERWSSSGKNMIEFEARHFFVLPEEYKRLHAEYREKQKLIEQQSSDIRIQADSLITRIQLASDKNLQRMINEVDDMGDISLMDSTLKWLTGGNPLKQIE